MHLKPYEYKGAIVRAPVSFIEATEEERSRVCNGMGAKGLGWMVPDTMYGLNVTAAGDIHDWTYEYPGLKSRESLDLLFYHNMLDIIKQHDGWRWVQWMRRRRALKYYKAVQVFGAKHFKGS